MANSDYVARNIIRGFCPTAVLAASITQLQTSITMSGFTSPIPEGVTINMAAMIDNEIVVVTSRTGDSLTIGRGCCDTVPATHAAGARIWFFDASIGNDGVEYGATEAIGVKVLPKTSTSVVSIPNSPPNGITFNWRFFRPYPPGLVQANGVAWFTPQTFDAGSPNLAFTWKHRDRVGQFDQLVDHAQDNIGPEAGTTYTARVYKADNTLVRTTTGLSGTSWTYDRATAKTDFGVTTGLHAGYVTIFSVRDAMESYQGYRIDFTLDADDPLSYPPLSSIPVYYKFDGTNGQQAGLVNSGSLGGTANLNGTQTLTTTAPKLGSASVTWSPGAGNSNVELKNDIALRVLDGGKLTFGGWIKAIYPGSITVSRSYSLYYNFAGDVNIGNQCYVQCGVQFSSSNPRFILNCGNSTVPVSLSQDQALNNDVWNHFEISVDGPTAYLFWNGALVATGNVGTGRTTGEHLVELRPVGTTNPDGVTVRFDDIYVIPGVCVHTASFTPPAAQFT